MIKPRALISYEYVKPALDVVGALHKRMDFLLDSGAFTAWKMGKSINIDEYQYFLKHYARMFWGYFNLDVIGDPAASMDNLLKLRSAGFDPIPVITRGNTIRQAMPLKDRKSRVAVGGLVGAKDQAEFIASLGPALRNKRVHLLGVTDPLPLNNKHVMTCDSSSWSQSYRWGSLDIFNKTLDAKKAKAKHPDFLALAKFCDVSEESMLMGWSRKKHGIELPYAVKFASIKAVSHSAAMQHHAITYFPVVSDLDEIKFLAWGFNLWNQKIRGAKWGI